MQYTKQGSVTGVQIAYIGGGSRGWAWTFMTDLANEKRISGTVRLYDIDREAALKNERIGNHLMSREEAAGNWEFITAGSAGKEIRELILPHIENHERIFRAAYGAVRGENMDKCRQLVYDAFMNDPLVKGHHPSGEDVRSLVDDMISATAAYLPECWKK
jgi:alpha-galactosidase/6-phospho-beta-glucosidase family protein